MAEFKYLRKVRFFPLFPYGYCSKQAASLEGRNNYCATLLLLGNDPEETIAQCLQHRRNALDRARFSGYTMDIEKINHVIEDHLDGFDFYICCFPEQASWYQKLFPGKTIL